MKQELEKCSLDLKEKFPCVFLLQKPPWPRTLAVPSPVCDCVCKGDFSPVIQVLIGADGILSWYIYQKIALSPASPLPPW